MDDRHKRLAAAKKKLQEYKNQRKDNNVNDSVDSSSSKKSDDSETDPSKEDNHSEVVDFSISTSIESVDGINVDTPGGNSYQFEVSQSLVEEPHNTNTSATVVDIPNNFDQSQQASPPPVLLNVDPVQNMEKDIAKDVDKQEIVVVEKVEIQVNEASTQCDDEISNIQAQNDVLENLEKELGSLRKENSLLTNRETELLHQLETSERLIRDLRKEVNQFKQQGNVHHQLEELQNAIGIITKSKMDLAEQLSNEQDKTKELLTNLGSRGKELEHLRKENAQLRTDISLLRTKLEEEHMKNQLLDDQRRQFSNQVETLERKLSSTESSHSSCTVEHEKPLRSPHSHNEVTSAQQDSPVINGHHIGSDHKCDHGHHDHHDHDDHHDHEDHHDHDHHGHHDYDDHSHHDHDDHSHHDHDDHEHTCKNTDHHHEHGDYESAEDNNNKTLVELRKTLKRLEWENATYEAELVKLGPLKSLEPKVQELQTRNVALKQEVDRLEHLVIQLQGENDTIGDYIQLYQTQRLALRQHAKENDELVESLSREKNELLLKLSELNHAVEKLASSQPQPDASVLGSKIRDLIVDVNTKVHKVHEPYTCSVCSGSRLMTV